MTRVLPYVEPPELVLIPAGALGADNPAFSIKAFGLLVAIGVYGGAWLALTYGTRRGLSTRALGSFIAHVVIAGFVFGHVLEVIFYTPERLLHDPGALFRLWDGLSSFGGFIGGAIGAFSWRWRHRSPILPYADAVASGLPVGWMFGRAGCAVVHDHPGIASDSWIAVAYPGGSRLDLGLLELLAVIPLAIGFYALRRRAWPWGFLVGVLATTYAPLRFALDFWRIVQPVELEGAVLLPDRRYWALTPAQWACVALGAFGAVLVAQALRRREYNAAYAAPRMPEAFSAPRSDADSKGGGRDANEQG